MVNGKTSDEGRVEVKHKGQWGTVCDDLWDLNDAHVVCRSLGLPKAKQALRYAYFGRGTGPIWLDNLRCSGNEKSLFLCRHSGVGSHNCGHGEDASVVCGEPSGECQAIRCYLVIVKYTQMETIESP